MIRGMQDMTKQLKPWLAALLSFFIPGLGLIYAGKVKIAITFFIGFIIIALKVRPDNRRIRSITRADIYSIFAH